MDPINYMSQSSQQLSPRSDPVHGHGAWLAQTHHSMGGPWPPPNPHYLPSPQPSRGLPGLDPFHVGMQGTLPHPDRSLRTPTTMPLPNTLLGLASLSQNQTWIPAAPPYPGGPASAGTAGHGLPPVGFIARMGGSEPEGGRPPGSGPLSADEHRGFVDVLSGTNPVPTAPMQQRLQTTASRDEVAAANASAGAVQGATPEARLPLQFNPGGHQRPLIANGSSASATQVVNHQYQHQALPQPQPHHPPRQRLHNRQHHSLPFDQTTPPRRATAHGSSSPTTPPSPNTPRPHHSGRATFLATSLSTPRNSSALPSPVSDRRRQGYSRARRYMSSRHAAASDPVQNLTDFVEMADHSRQALSESSSSGLSRGGNNPMFDDAASVRQAQLARGAEVKLIASRAALRTLQSVDKNDLPKSEQVCVICYNEYNEMSPEGVSEAPLRLPRCKHVFGDHCIKKWFEESDSCPYCRDKLPSEPKNSQGTARAFMNLMRLRGLQPSELEENLYRRALSGSVADAEFGEYVHSMRPQAFVHERRSPPDDATGQDQRRTRRRRRSPSPHGALEGVAGNNVTEAPAHSPEAVVDLGGDEDSTPSVAYMRHIMVLMGEDAVQSLNGVRRQGSSTTGGDAAGGHQGHAGVPPFTAFHNPGVWSSSQRRRW
ncbi:hypothetical protein JDV02_007073 [Purpureocillium takamizusanense]|uniref:RING-type domain-containing protein n=1 Tax=Purpureocillium takamizusanense TaxID=2060973 RepID=A0A9Q8QK14_9HYPO|nr:uncharacterized protein JDV02_007073 [Purpureocillium takamizusanense]UNI21045.1 hypothetical protein JDV02_007073 [Purpureocillium takamizusanense]